MPSNTTSPLTLDFSVKTWTETARRLGDFRGERLLSLHNKLQGVDDWTLYRWARGLSEPKGLYRAMLDKALAEEAPEPEQAAVA